MKREKNSILSSLAGSTNYMLVCHNKLFSTSFTAAAEAWSDIRLTTSIYGTFWVRKGASVKPCLGYLKLRLDL